MAIQVKGEYSYSVSLHFIPSIINDDDSGLDVEDIKNIEAFMGQLAFDHDNFIICVPDDIDAEKDFGWCEVSDKYSEVVPITVLEVGVELDD